MTRKQLFVEVIHFIAHGSWLPTYGDPLQDCFGLKVYYLLLCWKFAPRAVGKSNPCLIVPPPHSHGLNVRAEQEREGSV